MLTQLASPVRGHRSPFSQGRAEADAVLRRLLAFGSASAPLALHTKIYDVGHAAQCHGSER